VIHSGHAQEVVRASGGDLRQCLAQLQFWLGPSHVSASQLQQQQPQQQRHQHEQQQHLQQQHHQQQQRHQHEQQHQRQQHHRQRQLQLCHESLGSDRANNGGVPGVQVGFARLTALLLFRLQH